jgi:histidine ammonia-lyase
VGKFRDAAGREWDVSINVGVVMALKAAGFDFYKLAENKGKALVNLYQDDFAFAELLWKLVESQAKAANVSAAEFYAALAGQALDDAWKEFGAAYVGFTRGEETRSALRKVLDEIEALEKLRASKTQEAMAKAAKMTRDRLDKLQAEQFSDAAISKALNEAMPSPTPPK